MQETAEEDRAVSVTSEIPDGKLRACCRSLNSGPTHTPAHRGGQGVRRLRAGSVRGVRHTGNSLTVECHELCTCTVRPARRGEASRSPVTVWDLWSPHPGPRGHCGQGSPRAWRSRAPTPAAAGPIPGVRARASGFGGPEAAPPTRVRPAPAPPRGAPGPRPRTWLSPTQKTRPPRLRHTRASRGRAAAAQKAKEQREARSRCTVARTSAAGRRPQRAHRYR